MEQTAFFKHVAGTTFLHRMPPALKIVLMVALAVAAFRCPALPALCLWAALAVFSVAVLRVPPRTVLADQKPALAYLVLLYAASVASNALLLAAGDVPPGTHALAFLLAPTLTNLPLLAHLALSLQVTSLFYHTTSSVQFHEGFSALERAVTRREATPLADSLSLTLTFIPRMAAFWQRIDTAWRSRGGKPGIRRILRLVPVLFRTAMAEAARTALARANRT